MTPAPSQMRKLAEAARLAADGEPLENAKAKHIQAAETWERLATRAEAVQDGRLRLTDVLGEKD
jgi:hypothetical protein